MGVKSSVGLCVLLGVFAACAQAAPVCPPPAPPAPCNCDVAPLAATAKPTIDDPLRPKDAGVSDLASLTLADAAADAGVAALPEAPKDAGTVATGASKPHPKPVAAPAANGDPSSCGTKENLCPLQKLMRGEVAAAKTGPAMASAFTHTAGLSPNASWTWRAIAMKGAELARAGDTEGAKAQCKACHEAYKGPYKATYRARAVH